jgi:hypothetical protein
MNLQCQRHEYASGIAFVRYLAPITVFHHDKCKVPKIFSFPSVRICYKQKYSAFLLVRSFGNPSFCNKESWEAHTTTPSVFSVFVYVCVCACALGYVLLFFYTSNLIEGSLEPWIVGGGTVHTKDKSVNNCIGRYFFEIGEVTEGLESYY